MLSAFGPVTTSLLVGDSGSMLFWLRSRVIDSRAACRVASRPACHRGVRLAGVDHRVIEEPELELQREDPP